MSKSDDKKKGTTTSATQPGAVAVAVEEPNSTVTSDWASRSNQRTRTTTGSSATQPEALLVDTCEPTLEELTTSTPLSTSCRLVKKTKKNKPATSPGAVAVSITRGDNKNRALPNPAVRPTFPKIGLAKKRRTKAATVPGAVAGKGPNEGFKEQDFVASPTLLERESAGSVPKERDRFQDSKSSVTSDNDVSFSKEGTVMPSESGRPIVTQRVTIAPKGRARFMGRHTTLSFQEQDRDQTAVHRTQTAAPIIMTTMPQYHDESIMQNQPAPIQRWTPVGAPTYDTSRSGGTSNAKQRFGSGAAAPGAVALAPGSTNSGGSNDVLVSEVHLAKSHGGRGKHDGASNKEIYSNKCIVLGDSATLRSASTTGKPGAVAMTAIEESFVVDKARMKNRRAKRASGGLRCNPPQSLDYSVSHYDDDAVLEGDGEYDGIPATLLSMTTCPPIFPLHNDRSRAVATALASTFILDTNVTASNDSLGGDTNPALVEAAVTQSSTHMNSLRQTSNLVTESSTREAGALATPEDASFFVVDRVKKDDKPWCCRKRWIIFGAVVVLIIIVGGVFGGVVASGSGGSNDSSAPTLTPTVSLVDDSRWMDLIEAASPKTSFQDPTAAASLALEWMRSDPYSVDLDDDLFLQRFAFITLWYSTNGPKWFMSPTWLDTGGSECDWEGVFSCSVDGVVFDLSLATSYSDRSFNLAGRIPIELGLLSSLESLDLTRNALVGTVPTELAQLTSAHTLRLRRNSLNGTIPTEFGNLSLMKRLFLSFNQLVGAIPTELLQLAALEQLALDSNLLEGPILIGPWSKLSNLGIAVNKLSGTIPTEIGTLTSLQILLLGSNNYESGIVRMPPELGQLTLLTRLTLNDAHLSSPIPKEIGALGALKIIDLGGNQLSGPIPAEFGKLTALSVLRLGFNKLTGPIPAALEALALLRELVLLGNNFLTGTMPQAICDTGDVEPEIDCLAVECSCCIGMSGPC